VPGYRVARRLRCYQSVRKGGASIVRGNDRQEGDMIPLVNALRSSILLFLLLAIFGGGTASSADAQVPNKAAFGDKATFQSQDVAYAASPDGQAFTVNFRSAFEVAVDKSPVATQAFSLVVPVSGTNIDASLSFQGFVAVSEGALATLIITVNDTSTVLRYRPGFNDSVTVQHHYRAKSPGELRIAVFLLAERDQTQANASANMHFDTIDGMMAGANRKPAKKH
jgi:hypothetical protein